MHCRSSSAHRLQVVCIYGKKLPPPSPYLGGTGGATGGVRGGGTGGYGWEVRGVQGGGVRGGGTGWYGGYGGGAGRRYWGGTGGM